MYARDIIRRAFRSLRSAKTRSLLTSFAIAVGAFALTLTFSASNGANNYAASIIKANFDPSELIVSANNDLFSTTDASTPQEYSQNASNVTSQTGNTTQVESLDDQDVVKLKNIVGVESVRVNSIRNITYVTRDGQRKYNATTQAYSQYKSPELLAGKISTKMKDSDIIVPEAFLSSLGIGSPNDAIGKVIRLAVQQQSDQSSILSALKGGDTSAAISSLSQNNKVIEKKFTIVAVSKKVTVLSTPGTALYLTISPEAITSLSDIATKGTNDYHKYLSVYVKVRDGTDKSKLMEVQSKIKKLGYATQSVIDTEETITQVITVLQAIVLVFGFIAVIASVFGVINTMYISVMQRTREIGLMKALGMPSHGIATLFLIEASLLGLLGGLIGSITAVVVGTLLNPFISKQLGIGDVTILDFHVEQIFALLLVLTVVAMLAGLMPARKAARLDPIEALKTE